MKLSLIIPVYNSEDYLAECVESVLSQDYTDFELIMIDDGSKDKSLDICNQYASKYPNIRVITEENQGPSMARNIGVEIAEGDFIAFIDSDDRVLDDYFKTVSSFLCNELDMLWFGSFHTNGNKMEKKAFPAAELKTNKELLTYVSDEYYSGDICSCVNKIYSRKLIQNYQIRFPQDTVVEEDLQFVLSCIDKANSTVIIENCIYVYNQHLKGSVTTRYNPTKFSDKISALQVEFGFAIKWGSDRLKAAFTDNYLQYISSCINNLLYTACPLTASQKIVEIKKMFNHECTIECLKSTGEISTRSKIMKVLIQLQLYRISYVVHWIVFRARGRS